MNLADIRRRRIKEYLSYSEMRLFFQDRDAYYRRYVRGESDPGTKEQRLGTIVHATMEQPLYPWLHQMRKSGEFTKRECVTAAKMIDGLRSRMAGEGYEHEAVVIASLTVKDGGSEIPVKLLSVFDGLNRNTHKLGEIKTTRTPARWSQLAVDTNEQLSFYAMVYQLACHRFFTEITLYRVNTQTGSAKVYRTARGPMDIWAIRGRVCECVRELNRLGWWQLRLSRKERSIRDSGMKQVPLAV